MISKTFTLVAIFFLICCFGLQTDSQVVQVQEFFEAQQSQGLIKPQKNPRIKQTTSVGKNTGSPFDQYDQSLIQVRKFIIYSGNLIDAFQVEYQNGYKSNIRGGEGGDKSIWMIPEGEYIVKVDLRAGDVIDSIQFTTDKGTKSPKWGKDGGQPDTIEIPSGYKIVGFFGGEGWWLDRIGFNIVPINETEKIEQNQEM